jgi:hypothetical protein
VKEKRSPGEPTGGDIEVDDESSRWEGERPPGVYEMQDADVIDYSMISEMDESQSDS